MRQCTVVLLSAVLLTPVPGLPQAEPAFGPATYPDTEYVSGRSGFEKRLKGRLTIGEDGIQFASNDGRPVFTISVDTVAGVTNAVETEPGSVGRKMLLGVFAGRREEYLTIRTQTAEAAEAVVFRCRKKTSEAMAAKIEFVLKRAQAVSTP